MFTVEKIDPLQRLAKHGIHIRYKTSIIAKHSPLHTFHVFF